MQAQSIEEDCLHCHVKQLVSMCTLKRRSRISKPTSRMKHYGMILLQNSLMNLAKLQRNLKMNWYIILKI